MIQVSAWQSATLLLQISCKSMQPVPAWAKEMIRTLLIINILAYEENLRKTIASIRKSCGEVCNQNIVGKPGKYFNFISKQVCYIFQKIQIHGSR